MKTVAAILSLLILAASFMTASCGSSASGDSGAGKQYYVYDSNSKKLGRLLGYVWASTPITFVAGNGMITVMPNGFLQNYVSGYGMCRYASADCSGDCLVDLVSDDIIQGPFPVIIGKDSSMHIHDGSAAVSTTFNSLWSSSGCNAYSAAANLAATAAYSHPIGIVPGGIGNQSFGTPPYSFVEE